MNEDEKIDKATSPESSNLSDVTSSGLDQLEKIKETWKMNKHLFPSQSDKLFRRLKAVIEGE